jgi:hypothetical protein
MPAPNTELQRRFAVAFANNGGNATRAAIEAGYSPNSADDLGRKTFQLPHVQAMIFAELARLRAKAGAVGLDTLIRIAQCEKASAPARVAAGRGLLEFAGLAKEAGVVDDRSANAPDYKSILDTFANMSKMGAAAAQQVAAR